MVAGECWKSSEQNDAVEYCESMAARWIAYEEKGRIATSLDELVDQCTKQPTEETMAVLSVRAEWYDRERILGLCEFRRTWSNNLVFDFLAVRPDLIVGEPRPISGIGTAMLFHLAQIAEILAVETVWAETSFTSVGLYQRMLGRSDFTDLLTCAREEFCDRFGVRN